MAQRPNVPKFGNWDNGDDVPYTIYFDKARQNRTGGRIINPNDPQQNPDINAHIASPSQDPPSRARTRPSEEQRVQASVRQTNEHLVSREDPGPKQNAKSPGPQTTVRHSGGFERSPLHQHYQGRINGKGAGSLSLDGRNPPSESSHGGTPGRSRLRPIMKGNETPERGAAVPRFGDWDETNPSSGDNYTQLFNVVRNEKQNGPIDANKPSSTTMQQRQRERQQQVDDGCKMCCFPWGRK